MFERRSAGRRWRPPKRGRDVLVNFDLEPTCPVCRTSVARAQARLSGIADEDTHLGTFDIVECPGCNLVVTRPVPTDDSLPSLYAGDNALDFARSANPIIEFLKATLARRAIRTLWQRELGAKPGLRCLDYGAGPGYTAIALRDVIPGAEVTVADFDVPPQAERGIRSLSFAHLSASRDGFDLILVRHVLEHLKNPIETLRSLVARLNSNGIVYIEVPNLEAGLTRLLGRRSPAYFVPRHIAHYTVSTLARTIERAVPDVHYTIGETELPLMGNALAIRFGAPRSSTLCRIGGIALHPLQLAIGRLSVPTCLTAIIQA